MYCRHCIDESSSEDEGDSIFTPPAEAKETTSIEKETTSEAKETTSEAKEAATEEKEEATPMEVEMKLAPQEAQPATSSLLALLTHRTGAQPEQEMNISTNSSPHVFSALLWLNLKLLLNDYKKYIIAVLALACWILLSILYSSFNLQTKCPDGSYAAYSWNCIDNNDPPRWTPGYDSAVMDSGFRSPA